MHRRRLSHGSYPAQMLLTLFPDRRPEYPEAPAAAGDDALTFDIMSAGGVGVISVFGNAFPREMTQLVAAVQEGRIDDARLMNESLKELFRLIFVDGNPSGVKALMNIQGRLENVLRLPLVPAREETCRLLKQAIATIHG